MKKTKVFCCVFIILACVISGYCIWLTFRTVKIIAVHYVYNSNCILVDNFPLSDRGKINWWMKNKDYLKEKYNIPKSAPYGGFDVTFWDFGNGYQKEGKQDRLCFYDMKTDKNCINKDAVFSVREHPGKKMIFITYEGRYSINGDGEIMKLENHINNSTEK